VRVLLIVGVCVLVGVLLLLMVGLTVEVLEIVGVLVGSGVCVIKVGVNQLSKSTDDLLGV